MCLLTRTDFSERAPGSGDVLHNVLQLLVREANNIQRCLPSSPVTPTTRHPYPLSPHSHPPTPNWTMLTQNNESFHAHHNLAAHLIAQSNSVTLSPAPSVESQSGSPQHVENQVQVFNHSIFGSSSNGSGSNQSDSDEDSYNEMKNGNSSSPPNTPSAYSLPPPLSLMPPRSPKEAVSSPILKREFFPSDASEPNTSTYTSFCNNHLTWSTFRFYVRR